jgi:hypothetical protein
LNANTQTVTWQGASGTRYTYYAYPIGTTFLPGPGNYCFAKVGADGRWAALYFGQTGDLSDRFESHHKADCARRRGATHIHAHVNDGGEASRLREEADLIAAYKPPCNG